MKLRSVNLMPLSYILIKFDVFQSINGGGRLNIYLQEVTFMEDFGKAITDADKEKASQCPC